MSLGCLRGVSGLSRGLMGGVLSSLSFGATFQTSGVAAAHVSRAEAEAIVDKRDGEPHVHARHGPPLQLPFEQVGAQGGLRRAASLGRRCRRELLEELAGRWCARRERAPPPPPRRCLAQTGRRASRGRAGRAAAPGRRRRRRGAARAPRRARASLRGGDVSRTCHGTCHGRVQAASEPATPAPLGAPAAVPPLLAAPRGVATWQAESRGRIAIPLRLGAKGCYTRLAPESGKRVEELAPEPLVLNESMISSRSSVINYQSSPPNRAQQLLRAIRAPSPARATSAA